MIPAVLLPLVLMLAMLLPHLPGRYDASAAALSFVSQVASYASLLLVPIGLAWLASRRGARLWHRLALVTCGFIALLIAIAAAAVNSLALGVLLGLLAIIGVRAAHARTLADLQRADGRGTGPPLALVCVPLVLVAFAIVAMPRAAAWSRDRAILHSTALIAEIESFHQRRGFYPLSLQSLNRDVSTGVVGIERFQYEPNGEGYNLFFVRPDVSLDAEEVVMFNRRGEHRFASHELDILQFDGEQLDLRRGDRRRTALAQEHWISIIFE
jgi:hypothetical protein